VVTTYRKFAVATRNTLEAVHFDGITNANKESYLSSPTLSHSMDHNSSNSDPKFYPFILFNRQSDSLCNTGWRQIAGCIIA
jgi:hypothetical protein